MKQFLRDFAKIHPEPSTDQLLRDLATPERFLPGLSVVNSIQEDVLKLQQSVASVQSAYPEFHQQVALIQELQWAIYESFGVPGLEALSREAREVMAPGERIQREIEELLPLTVTQLVHNLNPLLGIDFESEAELVESHEEVDDTSQPVSKQDHQEFVALETPTGNKSVAPVGIVSSERQIALVQKIPPPLLTSMPTENTVLAYCVSFSLNTQLAKRLAFALELNGATMEAVFGNASRKIDKRLRKQGVDTKKWDGITEFLNLSELRRAAQWVFQEVTGAVPLPLEQLRFRRLVLDHRNDLSHGRNVALSQTEEMLELTLEILEALEDIKLLQIH